MGAEVKGGGVGKGHTSDSKRGGEQTERECNSQVDDFEHSVYCDSYDAKWEKQEPYEGIGDQGQQGQGPADHKQNAP